MRLIKHNDLWLSTAGFDVFSVQTQLPVDGQAQKYTRNVSLHPHVGTHALSDPINIFFFSKYNDGTKIIAIVPLEICRIRFVLL